MKRLGYRFENYCYDVDCGDVDMGVAVYKGNSKKPIREVPMCDIHELKEMSDEELEMWIEKNV